MTGLRSGPASAAAPLLGAGLLLAFALVPAGPAPASGDPAFGHWLVENGRAVVEIHPCGVSACGRIAWLAEPFDAAGLPKRDVNNPDPALRVRTLCGLPLIRDLRPEGGGAWQDGTIYNSRDGSEWSVEIDVDAPDRLEVRGFLGISLLGRTQVWTRESMRTSCSRMREPGSDR